MTAKKKDNKDPENVGKDPQIRIKTVQDLYMFREGLLRASRKGAKFTYAVAKNLRSVNIEIEDLETAIKPSEGFTKFQKEIEKLNKLWCRKDALGEMVMLPKKMGDKIIQVYDVIGKGDPLSDYEIVVKKLKEECKEDLEEHQMKIDDYNEFAMKNDFVFQPFMISLSDVPDEAGSVMENIIYMIRDVKEI